jgi:hypothetical protein
MAIKVDNTTVISDDGSLVNIEGLVEQQTEFTCSGNVEEGDFVKLVLDGTGNIRVQTINPPNPSFSQSTSQGLYVNYDDFAKNWKGENFPSAQYNDDRISMHLSSTDEAPGLGLYSTIGSSTQFLPRELVFSEESIYLEKQDLYVKAFVEYRCPGGGESGVGIPSEAVDNTRIRIGYISFRMLRNKNQKTVDYDSIREETLMKVEGEDLEFWWSLLNGRDAHYSRNNQWGGDQYIQSSNNPQRNLQHYGAFGNVDDMDDAFNKRDILINVHRPSLQLMYEGEMPVFTLFYYLPTYSSEVKVSPFSETYFSFYGNIHTLTFKLFPDTTDFPHNGLTYYPTQEVPEDIGYIGAEDWPKVHPGWASGKGTDYSAFPPYGYFRWIENSEGLNSFTGWDQPTELGKLVRSVNQGAGFNIKAYSYSETKGFLITIPNQNYPYVLGNYSSYSGIPPGGVWIHYYEVDPFTCKLTFTESRQIRNGKDDDPSNRIRNPYSKIKIVKDTTRNFLICTYGADGFNGGRLEYFVLDADDPTVEIPTSGNYLGLGEDVYDDYDIFYSEEEDLLFISSLNHYNNGLAGGNNNDKLYTKIVQPAYVPATNTFFTLQRDSKSYSFFTPEATLTTDPSPYELIAKGSAVLGNYREMKIHHVLNGNMVFSFMWNKYQEINHTPPLAYTSYLMPFDPTIQSNVYVRYNSAVDQFNAFISSQEDLDISKVGSSFEDMSLGASAALYHQYTLWGTTAITFKGGSESQFSYFKTFPLLTEFDYNLNHIINAHLFLPQNKILNNSLDLDSAFVKDTPSAGIVEPYLKSKEIRVFNGTSFNDVFGVAESNGSDGTLIPVSYDGMITDKLASKIKGSKGGRVLLSMDLRVIDFNKNSLVDYYDLGNFKDLGIVVSNDKVYLSLR